MFLRLLRCFTSAGSRSDAKSERLRFTQSDCSIRTSPDQRLLHTSPKLIAATPRPSSPHNAKASTIRPYITTFFFFPHTTKWRVGLFSSHFSASAFLCWWQTSTIATCYVRGCEYHSGEKTTYVLGFFRNDIPCSDILLSEHCFCFNT